MKKRNIFFLLLFGILVVVVMVWIVGPEEIMSAVKSADPFYIALAVISQFATLALLTIRWGLIINSLDIEVPKRELFPMLLVGMMINNITPSGRGGGEPVRAYMLSRSSESSVESAFATVIVDRALDTFPMLFLAIITIISMIFFFELNIGVIIALVTSVVVITSLFLIFMYMCINEAAGEKIVLWAVKIVRKFKDYDNLEEKALEALGNFQYSFKLMIKDKKLGVYGILISCASWALEIIRVYLVFCAFGVNASIIIIAEVFIISCLLGIIPLLPGGLGTVDGTMVLLYSAAGITSSISAAVTVIERLISFWMVTALGVICLPLFGKQVFDHILEKTD